MPGLPSLKSHPKTKPRRQFHLNNPVEASRINLNPASHCPQGN